jgi:DDE superfamily endonuclease
VGSVHDQARAAALGELTRFRQEFYASLTARSDVLFELTDAVLCADGPVTTLVDLTLVAEHRRGHGAMYDALNHGRVEPDRFRRTLASLPLPRAADGRIVLAVDVSPWLRSDAPTSAERLFCHVYGRGKNQAQLIPGWPYSFVAALEPGRTSWTALLDAVRLGPTDNATAVTADQLRAVVGRLTAAGHWQHGDPDILIVTDAGYDITRLAFVLADLPVELLGRIRSDRVLRLPKPPRPPRHHRPPTQARTRVRPGQARHLARAGTHHDHRHHPLRHRDRHQLGPAPSPAHPPRLLARPQRRPARHRGHPHPAAGRPPAR